MPSPRRVVILFSAPPSPVTVDRGPVFVHHPCGGRGPAGVRGLTFRRFFAGEAAGAASPDQKPTKSRPADLPKAVLKTSFNFVLGPRLPRWVRGRVWTGISWGDRGFGADSGPYPGDNLILILILTLSAAGTCGHVGEIVKLHPPATVHFKHYLLEGLSSQRW